MIKEIKETIKRALRSVLPKRIAEIAIKIGSSVSLTFIRILIAIDTICLKRKFPQFRDFDRLSNEHSKILQPYYNKYISSISIDEMAISIELSVFLSVLCKLLTPRGILDLGSGFSSFVFRFYSQKADPKPIVYSVDDSKEWLKKTEIFLRDNNVPTDNIVVWKTFSENNAETFDIILHDLGSIEVRKNTLEDIMKLVRPGGVIILDDLHQVEYALFVKETIKKYRLRCYNLKEFTKDKFGRFSFLLVA